jgi:hypothetical protein
MIVCASSKLGYKLPVVAVLAAANTALVDLRFAPHEMQKSIVISDFILTAADLVGRVIAGWASAVFTTA